MTSENPKPPPLAPGAIDYAGTATDPNSRRNVRRRMAVGFLVYVLLSALCLFVTAQTTNAFWMFAAWCWLTLAALGITLWLRLARGKKGYGYGVLTALLCALLIGIGLLILLICAGTFR